MIIHINKQRTIKCSCVSRHVFHVICSWTRLRHAHVLGDLFKLEKKTQRSHEWRFDVCYVGEGVTLLQVSGLHFPFKILIHFPCRTKPGITRATAASYQSHNLMPCQGDSSGVTLSLRSGPSIEASSISSLMLGSLFELWLWKKWSKSRRKNNNKNSSSSSRETFLAE